uniref:FA complementation group D2 n=1 Tax=Cyprinus carpio TaxID=7962 RepID=A0A8C1VBP9_CYPCA
TKSSVQDSYPDSVFVQFLRESGVTLTAGSTANEIAVDQVIFQKRLQQQLRKHPRFPNIIQEFISALETYIEDPERFRNCLLPCVPSSTSQQDANSGSYQESLVRLLLGIEMLKNCQKNKKKKYFFLIVINTLFEKLPEFMFEGVSEDGLNVPRLIINQLKWLDRIVDGKDLSSKLMQMVSVAPVEIQRDIITSLPEILEDSQHGDIAKELNALLQQNTQLPVPILDALSSLNLSSALLSEVRDVVMGTLSAVQLEDLPVIVKFILHSISASDANEVVCDLRKKLELEQCVLPAVLQASQSRMKSKAMSGVPSCNNGQDSVALVLEVIKSAIRFQKTISEAWLKVSSYNHDSFFCFTFWYNISMQLNRRGAERVLRVKVRKGLIQENLLQKTFKGHAQVMRGYFPSILALAQGLLRSPDCCVVSFGGHMYKQAFTAFDSYCQQEVVGSLVTHACSGVSGEVDVALELLCELVSQKPAEMSQFTVFVKGILDYMDNLTSQQIRRLFHLLSCLAFGQEQHGGHIQDDMHIVIRKQLSSTVPKYKRIGIIGAVMMVGSMGACRNKPDGSQGGTLPKETHRQVMALLELVRSCSESSPEAAALYYDELANLLQTCKLDPLVQVPFVFPAYVMHNLDEDESQGGIAINLLPLMTQDQQRVSPLCLSSFFRLLRLCEEVQHQGDLEEIDALLGCPLILTDMEVVEKVESLSKAEREFLCSLLFYTINWFRETVNAFCKQNDPEMKMKVVTRIQNITYLQSLLQTCLAGTRKTDYLLPQCVSLTTTDNCLLWQDLPEKENEKEKEKDAKSGVSLSSYWPFFRELDVEVLSVLQCGLLSRTLLDTELHSKLREEVQLGPAELLFLLEDMWRKLDFSLASAPAKKAPFLKSKTDRAVGFAHLQQKNAKEIATYCIELLPTLCTHLENCHNHFQCWLACLGVVDAPGVDVKEQQLMCSAYQLLLQVLHTTFSWAGFSGPEHRALLKSALGVLAGRLKEDETDLTLDQLSRHAFEYLQNFRSTVPSLNTALLLSFSPATLTKRFLCQEWVTASGEKERGNKYNDALQTLLSIYLEHTDDVLKAVEEIAGEGVPELLNAAKDANSRSWPTLNRHTFLVYYKSMMAVLERAVRKIPPSKQTDNQEVQSEKLLTWNLAVRDFHILINLVKMFDSRPVLTVCLKYGRLFLESFLKLGMPLLDYSFKKHKEDVQSLLKTFQLSTRQLHHMCGHSKIRQDTGLTNHVPALKKNLEQFVYRVKAMLTLNHCQEMFFFFFFFFALQGEEILSQRSQAVDEEEEESSQLQSEEEV